jgi:hypothetical protein
MLSTGTAMPSDDAPFIIESDEELQSGPLQENQGNYVRPTSQEKEIVRTHIKMPSTRCRFTTATGTVKDQFNGAV